MLMAVVKERGEERREGQKKKLRNKITRLARKCNSRTMRTVWPRDYLTRVVVVVKVGEGSQGD
jgi:preprotein translocase subunit SecE